MREVLRIELERNLEMIRETIGFLKSLGFEVHFDAEHFFDGYKSNKDYALKTLKAAGKADVIILCDTNGGTMPWEISGIMKDVRGRIDNMLGIHAHNDSGMAVINSIVALGCGVRHLQGTFNGLGERCGNMDWCEMLPILSEKIGMKLKQDISKLYRLSKYIERITGFNLAKNKPFVGENAFSHKGGIHIDAMIKNSSTYEHIDPAVVGNTRNFLLSEQVGRAGIVEAARRHGFRFKKEDPVVMDIYREIKDIQNFTDAELYLAIVKRVKETSEPFKVVSYDTEIKSDRGCKTDVKILIDREEFHEISEGVGPVHSFDMALRKGISKRYDIEGVKLSNFRVRILDSHKATAAKVEVYIEFVCNGMRWSTRGVSDDIIRASEEALVKGYKYYLLKSMKS